MAGTQQTERRGRYDFTAIEAKWQRYWEEHQSFRTLNPGDPGADTNKPKFYVLDMFPYPSGAGLHVGHPLGYCATDIVSRYKRMRGFNVLHPMGFDSFGLPAEQYAIKTGVHPAVTTGKNVDVYRRQLKMFGFSYDWDREVKTSDSSYYKFTQWMFARMFESWYDEKWRWVGAEGEDTVGRARPISTLTAELEAGRWGVDSSMQPVRAKDDPDRKEWADLSPEQRRRVISNQRLAFVDEVSVNWCPALGTVLANEEVDSDGRSAIGKHPVFRRPLHQWMLRITKYAERLLDDIEGVDWPEPIKLMQRNWVGKSTGAEVVFPLADKWSVQGGAWKCLDDDTKIEGPLSYTNFPHAIRVYTTRPDTLFGATYMVLAPEHELVEQITEPAQYDAVSEYVAAARNRSDLERTADTKDKTGVFTGAYAINPVNGQSIPIWVADYVLMGYGTGAIMAVPGHDTRDFEFAKTFGIPIIAVVMPGDDWFESVLTAADVRGWPEGEEDREKIRAAFREDPGTLPESFVGDGTSINSPGGGKVEVPGIACPLDGLPTGEAKARITDWLAAGGVGRGAVNYRLRDWIFSRQKYWGEPFPILHGDDGEMIAVPDDELPVELPSMEDFKPTPRDEDDVDSMPEPPLGRAKEWVTCQRDGRTYRHDLNTMPQWAGSCWYYLRFLDPTNPDKFCDPEAERYWMPVDLYVGGAEHAVLHLLYARFWHKFLYDLGHVSTREPFKKLYNQGMIQGFAYRTKSSVVVGPDEVEQRGEDDYVLKSSGEPVTRVIAKMSKSLHNVVNPDEIIAQYGADTFRLYEMYMGPLDAAKPWNTRDVPGLFKLCQRIWRLVVDPETGELSSAHTEDTPDEATLRVLHKTIKRVGEELEQLKINTAIAAIFDFVNFMTPRKKRPRAALEPFVLLLSPFVPHLAEELWQRLGHEASVGEQTWPEYDKKLARDEEVEVAVQVCGKIKARVTVSADADEESLKSAALADESVAKAIEGKTIRKVIVVKGRLVNIVAT